METSVSLEKLLELRKKALQKEQVQPASQTMQEKSLGSAVG